MNQTEEQIKPSYTDLQARLLEMEQVVAALRDHQVDAIVGENDVALVHLRQVEEALRDSGERYQAFIADNAEGIGRYEVEPAMPLALSEDEQVDYIAQHAVVGECNVAMARLAGYPSASEMIGRLGFPDPNELASRSLLVEMVRSGYRANYLEVPQRDPEGNERWLAVSYLGIVNKGKLNRIWSVQRDITERRRADQELRQRTTELSAVLAITRDLAGTLQVEPLLENLLTQLRTVIEFSAATVAIREREDFVAVAFDGPLPRTLVLGQRCPLTALLPLDRLMTTRQPVIFDDAGFSDLVTPAVFASVAAEPAPAGFEGRSWLLVPLFVKGVLMGVLLLEHSQPHHFSARQSELAQAFADHAAVAIENARLYGEARQLAAVNERQRLAAELHDSVSQAIYSISLAAHTGLANLDKRPERVRMILNHILGLAEGAFTDIRTLIYELRPESLARHGLVVAIERQAETLRSREQGQIHLDLCREPDLPIEAKEALYRIAQESMNNIVKHARARAVWLRLAIEGSEICLEVRDDGRGFDSGREYDGHLGLRVMRERAERLGGTLAVSSEPRAGTTVTARLPLPAANR